MATLPEVVQATGGPFFEARWRRSGTWYSEQFRLFRNAKDRCLEEIKAGADMAYINHLLTDEVVLSFGQDK